MIQRRIDKTADKYLMMTNKDRRIKLSSIKRGEGAVSTLGFVLFAISICIAGVGGWASFFAAESGAGGGGLEFEFVFFPIAIFVEIAVCRTAKNSVPLWVLLGTSAFATLITYGIFIYWIFYSIFFIFVEIKLIAMKMIPGYPIFEDKQLESYEMNLTIEQKAAYDKRMYADPNDVEAAKARDRENLDKILSGEIGLDEFLGVEKVDTKNVDMDYNVEYHEPVAIEPQEPDDDDDSAEAFFRRFEKKGGNLENKEKEKESWLEGGDANSAESYFDQFSESGGKLDENVSFQSHITFDRVKNNPNGGKDV